MFVMSCISLRDREGSIGGLESVTASHSGVALPYCVKSMVGIDTGVLVFLKSVVTNVRG